MTSNNKGRNVLGGIVFLVLAVFALFGGFQIIDKELIWRLAVSVIMLFWLIDGLKRGDWGSILFPAAIMAIVWLKYFGDEMGISVWGILLAALFGTIGLGFIFGNNHRAHHEPRVEYKPGNDGAMNRTESTTTDNAFVFSTSFATSVKYIKSDNFTNARINCSFGEAKIYFDDAIIGAGDATVDVDAKFGTIELYVPRTWYVTNNAKVIFGDVTEKNRSMTTGSPKLNLIGNVAFGSVIVFYV